MTTLKQLHELSEDLRRAPRYLRDQHVWNYCKELAGECSPSAGTGADDAAGVVRGARHEDDSAV